MKTRDEIIEAIGHEPFSTRRCFYGLLDQFATRPLDNEVVTVKWPNALSVISLQEWNTAYTSALEMAANHRLRSTDA